jgi:hypothetical protein
MVEGDAIRRGGILISDLLQSASRDVAPPAECSLHATGVDDEGAGEEYPSPPNGARDELSGERTLQVLD